jgi:putative transcriptional regulator
MKARVLKGSGRKNGITKSRGSRRRGASESAGASIIRGVKQAIAWAAGEDVPVRTHVVKIPYVDVREVRQRMRLSQDQFAQKFGFSPASLRNWEQGRRQPEGPARILLAVIDAHPRAVESVLVKIAGR